MSDKIDGNMLCCDSKQNRGKLGAPTVNETLNSYKLLSTNYLLSKLLSKDKLYPYPFFILYWQFRGFSLAERLLLNNTTLEIGFQDQNHIFAIVTFINVISLVSVFFTLAALSQLRTILIKIVISVLFHLFLLMISLTKIGGNWCLYYVCMFVYKDPILDHF